MKTCTKCNTIKELIEFHKSKKHKDGLSYYCKECVNITNQEYRNKHRGTEEYSIRIKGYIKKYNDKYPEKRKEINKNYYNKYPEKRKTKKYRQKQKIANKNYFNNPKNKDVIKKCKKTYETNPKNTLKVKARKVLNNKLRYDPTIKPKECESCNETKLVQGHHEDYSKPLDVKWLCRECHMALHKDLKNKENV